MKKDRKPEYHKKANLRIISRANGLFAVQSKISEARSKERDDWQDLNGAGKLSYEAAAHRMTIEAPLYIA